MPFNKLKTLRLRWSKEEQGYNINYPRKAHGYVMYDLMKLMKDKDIVEQLEMHCYDIKTLKISCDLKKEVVDDEERL